MPGFFQDIALKSEDCKTFDLETRQKKRKDAALFWAAMLGKIS